MTEACQKVIQYLFEEEQLDFITCGAFSYNHRSKRVQEKLGFKYLKTINHPTLLNTVEVCDTTIIYKEEYFLKKKIRLSEESYNSYNCNSIDYGYFIRYTDDEIYDMWDHNFNEVPSYVYNINQNIINQMLEITKIRNEQHLKITSNHELFLDENYFEKGIILTMALDNINNLEELNHNLIYKDVINDHIEEDIYNLDCKYYGDIYGIEYYQRRYHYLFERIKKDSRLNYLGVYLDNKIVGMCYYYIDHDIICLDDLLVEEEYRHHGIARTIIYHLTHKYNLPIYLHADSEDMPKDIYLKMGFKIINQTYEYIHMFNNIDNNIDNNK